MKAAVLRALFLDALYQVLDNKVFRILGMLVLLLIAFTFLVGWKNEGIWILFGAWKFSYVDLLGPFLPDNGASFKELDVDLQRRMVDNVQGLFVEGMSGTLGIALSIAATAFFMPRMLERGTADTLFTKPVSRIVLYLARYFAGILFVALLAVVLVVGMHLGFLTASGYSDPGFLWGAFTLVYVFALVHGVSVMIGALTRSSVAAILITLIFFAFTGCAHGIWIRKEWSQTREAKAGEQRATPAESESPPAGPAKESAKESAKENADESEESDSRGFLVLAIDSLHYVLPKTTDAGFLTKKLRRSLERRSDVYDDPYAAIVMDRGPAAVDGLEFERTGTTRISEWLGEARWVARGDDCEDVATIGLRRENSLVQPPDGPGDEPRRRERALSRMRVARDLENELRSRLGNEAGLTTWRNDGGILPESVVAWTEDAIAHEVHFFGWEDQFYRVEYTWSGAVAPGTREAVVEDFARAMEMPEVENLQQEQRVDRWYEAQLGLRAPLRFNVLFSIGSSLLFLMLVLGIGAWRLQRTEF